MREEGYKHAKTLEPKSGNLESLKQHYFSEGWNQGIKLGRSQAGHEGLPVCPHYKESGECMNNGGDCFHCGEQYD